MSKETREEVANALAYKNEPVQKADLLDPTITSTYLIAILQDAIPRAKHKILVTAICSDHHNDGPNGHAGGYCIDIWNADWQTFGDHGVVDVIQACVDSKYCWSIGLAGVAQQWAHEVKWPPGPFYWFMDAGADHIHVAAKSQSGGPGMRGG